LTRAKTDSIISFVAETTAHVFAPQNGGKMNKEDFCILVLDDLEEMRQDIEAMIVKQGYSVKGVGSVLELLGALQDCNFQVIFLDIILEPEISIRETMSLFEKMFPAASFEYRSVLTDFSLTVEDTVNGYFLLPLVKAICPTAAVIMLSNAIAEGSEADNVSNLKRYGAFEVVPKYTEAHRLPPGEIASLENEIRPMLAKLFRGASSKTSGGLP
jgi:CheY-like chemotaxis protein